MKVTAEQICRGTLELSDTAIDSRQQTHLVWAAPALICAMRYITNPRYLTEDENSIESRRLSSKKTNV